MRWWSGCRCWGVGLFRKRETSLDVIEDGFRVQHQGVQGDCVGAVLGAIPYRGIRWQDDEIHGCAVGYDRHVTEGAFGFLKLAEKITTGLHLPCAFSGVNIGSLGAMVGGGNGDEGVAALRAPELLEIVAGHQATHAEGNHREAILGAELRVDLGLEVLREFLKAGTAVVRLQFRDEALDAMVFQAVFQGIECLSVLQDAVDEHDALVAGLGGLRMAGNGGCEDAVEKQEEARGHGLSPEAS